MVVEKAIDHHWEQRWHEGRTGWDQSQSHLALVSFLQSAQADELGIPKSGRALVPGCGKGYDVHLFATRGLDTTGLDLAPTGVQAARDWISGQSSKTGKTEVICHDFFTFDPAEKFGLIFDYTFLCALPPSLNDQWAERMDYLASSDGILITLMYPLPPHAPDRPPYPLTVEKYHQLLDDRWELVWSADVPAEQMRTTGAKGGEKLGVWRKRQ